MNKRTPALNRFLVVRRGRKHEHVVRQFDDVVEARRFVSKQTNSKKMYVTPYVNSNAGQFVVS